MPSNESFVFEAKCTRKQLVACEMLSVTLLLKSFKWHVAQSQIVETYYYLNTNPIENNFAQICTVCARVPNAPRLRHLRARESERRTNPNKINKKKTRHLIDL